jgi:hypothetical protein
MTYSPSALARLKRAVRAGIDHCGGVDGAAATAGRQRSVAGDWNNLNHAAFPPLDCAFAIDEASLAAGRRCEILHRLAGELGHVAIPVPDFGGDAAAEGEALMEAVQEVGDVSGAIRDMLADGVRQPHERDRVVAEIDEALRSLARLRSIVCGASSAGAAHPGGSASGHAADARHRGAMPDGDLSPAGLRPAGRGPDLRAVEGGEDAA